MGGSFTHLLTILLTDILLYISLPLALHLLNHLRRAVLNELALVIDACPLRQTVRDVDHSLRVEHVASTSEALHQPAGPLCIRYECESCEYWEYNSPWLKLIPYLLILHVDQARKQQDHVLPFVHDRAVAVLASHFAGEHVLVALGCGIVPLEIVVPVLEVDVGFVEDGGPLEGCGCAVGS